MLAGRGFKEVSSLAGGIKAWKGEVARGPEQAGMAMISGNETQAGLLAVVFGLEKGLTDFYQIAAGTVEDAQAIQLMRKLAGVEEGHMARVKEMFEAAGPGPEDRRALENARSDTTEGGFDAGGLRDYLQENRMSAEELVDWAMALEAQAMDLYLRMAVRSSDPGAAGALRQVGNDEKGHLESLARLREQYVSD